jgi:hypothetical protein
LSVGIAELVVERGAAKGVLGKVGGCGTFATAAVHGLGAFCLGSAFGAVCLEGAVGIAAGPVLEVKGGAIKGILDLAVRGWGAAEDIATLVHRGAEARSAAVAFLDPFLDKITALAAWKRTGKRGQGGAKRGKRHREGKGGPRLQQPILCAGRWRLKNLLCGAGNKAAALGLNHGSHACFALCREEKIVALGTVHRDGKPAAKKHQAIRHHEER